MPYETILSALDLAGLHEVAEPVLVLDCGFDLADPDAGRRAYCEGHLPGAHYIHLDEDLSGAATGTNGRHPLPARETLAERLRALGLCNGMQVVCYDDQGSIFAARARWLLKWLGHREAAVLDGGKGAWTAAGFALESGSAELSAVGTFRSSDPLVADPVTAADVLARIGDEETQVLDARDAARFAGGESTLDPVAGHIPGARNRWFRDNLDEAGRFRTATELSAAFGSLLDGRAAILSCGSGVSACHNALAMEIAGLSGARLYPGSWSEWIADPARPVERG
jgi:thiosulfate/3-mercaptopyruvate sulfurtransferase